MYYKVIKDDKVIDVLDKLVYLKWQPRNKIMLSSNANDAQAILSSDENTIWREITLCEMPDEAGTYDIVKLVEIDQYEYKQLRALNLYTPDEIIDAYTLLLFEGGIL